MSIEQIRIIEPNSIDFKEGKTSYIVSLNNGQIVCMNKSLAKGISKTCFNCKREIRVYECTGNRWIKYNIDGTRHVDPRRESIRWST